MIYKNYKKEAGQTYIKLVWWNFGRKQIDFEGTIRDYFITKGFTVSTISHPKQKDIKGYRFKMPVSSSIITFDTFGNDYTNSAISAIKLFLTYLGDKARIYTIGRTIDVNH